jgi:hypothetical protein
VKRSPANPKNNSSNITSTDRGTFIFWNNNLQGHFTWSGQTAEGLKGIKV